MASEICDDCLQRTLKNRRGDLFNPTANPFDDGLDELLKCTSSFQPIKTYFSVSVMKCRRCGAVWLLGYYEDFDGLPVMAEWGVRKWVWRPLTSDHFAQIEAAAGTGTLDLEEFALSASSKHTLGTASRPTSGSDL